MGTRVNDFSNSRTAKECQKVLWNTPMHIFITTYDTLRNDIEYNILTKDQYSFFDIVILDEAHHIKKHKIQGISCHFESCNPEGDGH